MSRLWIIYCLAGLVIGLVIGVIGNALHVPTWVQYVVIVVIGGWTSVLIGRHLAPRSDRS